MRYTCSNNSCSCGTLKLECSLVYLLHWIQPVLLRYSNSLAVVPLQGDFVTTDGSEYALKEALFTKGPMTVSVDAAPDSFVFYSNGIYNNPACRSDYKGKRYLC